MRWNGQPYRANNCYRNGERRGLVPEELHKKLADQSGAELQGSQKGVYILRTCC